MGGNFWGPAWRNYKTFSCPETLNFLFLTFYFWMQFTWFSKLRTEKCQTDVCRQLCFLGPFTVPDVRKCDPAWQRLKVLIPACAIFGSFFPSLFCVTWCYLWTCCVVSSVKAQLLQCVQAAGSHLHLTAWVSLGSPFPADTCTQCNFWLCSSWGVQVLYLAAEGEQNQGMSCLILFPW